MVCAGVLTLPAKQKIKGRFHLPYINGKIIFPVLFLGALGTFYYFEPQFFDTIMDWKDPKEGEFRASIFFFFIVNFILCGVAFAKNLSLIPLIGLSSCLYLLTGMSHNNWFWFGLWFALGFVLQWAKNGIKRNK